jgi:hypothetical protein
LGRRICARFSLHEEHNREAMFAVECLVVEGRQIRGIFVPEPVGLNNVLGKLAQSL